MLGSKGASGSLALAFSLGVLLLSARAFANGVGIDEEIKRHEEHKERGSAFEKKGVGAMLQEEEEEEELEEEVIMDPVEEIEEDYWPEGSDLGVLAHVQA